MTNVSLFFNNSRKNIAIAPPRNSYSKVFLKMAFQELENVLKNTIERVHSSVKLQAVGLQLD